ncbi:MAG: hypothetical protein AAFV49_16815 [Pseudomonadota bacterium]
MGAWGGGLYSNDTALDLKDTISVLAKLPRFDERILPILLEENTWIEEEGHHEVDLFWYVVADQLHKRGIACDRALAEARDRLSREPGAYAAALNSEAGLRQWQRSLRSLRGRLERPLPERQKTSAALPEHRYAVGDVLAFPTMLGLGKGNGIHIVIDDGKVTYHSDRGPRGWFKPDGWGAVVLTGRGFVFDLIPYLRVAPVMVSGRSKPTLEEVRSSKFLFNNVGEPRVFRQGVFPNTSVIGRLSLDQSKLDAAPQDEGTPRNAVLCDYDMAGLLVSAECTDVKSAHEIYGPPALDVREFLL